MGWQYRKRTDGKINLALGNNVWNFLFDRKLNLASELPSDEFIIFIPREIEIETEAIPVNESNTPLKEYIARTIAECGIETDWRTDHGPHLPAARVVRVRKGKERNGRRRQLNCAGVRRLAPQRRQ